MNDSSSIFSIIDINNFVDMSERDLIPVHESLLLRFSFWLILINNQAKRIFKINNY